MKSTIKVSIVLFLYGIFSLGATAKELNDQEVEWKVGYNKCVTEIAKLKDKTERRQVKHSPECRQALLTVKKKVGNGRISQYMTFRHLIP